MLRLPPNFKVLLTNSPFIRLLGLLWLQQIVFNPSLHQYTSEQKLFWHTSDQICNCFFQKLEK